MITQDTINAMLSAAKKTGNDQAELLESDTDLILDAETFLWRVETGLMIGSRYETAEQALDNFNALSSLY